MAARISVLPLDVLETLSTKLNQNSGVCPKTRLLRLPHPRTSVPSLFLLHTPSDSEDASETILEIQAVAPPNPRSWFMDNEVISDGTLLIMTPIDPTFLLIPILQVVQPIDGSPGSFRPADDIFEDAVARLIKAQDAQSTAKDPSSATCEEDIHHLLDTRCIRGALRRVCDVKEISEDLVVYRFSPDKLLEYLRAKVARLSKPDLIECSRTMIRNLAKEGLMEDGKDELLESGRIRAACDLVAQYTPPPSRAALLSSYDFTKLEAYLQALQDDAAALAAASANTAGKKMKEAEAKTVADSKKRKGLAKVSQGVERLKKANTAGMAKLSSFFQKATK